ncbi:hypothetical protein WR25_17830 [Diploscapter pachys]|uniref:Uncharacterized protein n=1 Tax=Diploscapter pachys TaxID=2018661 RepID=A0A2A2KYN6_9BILA|nr:hypothetical protein WR25_17830 [Diploscapter pachys]
MQSSFFPYQTYTYRPPVWGDNRYFVSEYHEKQTGLSSGLAAGITIGIFFMVFIFTFGCRIYSQIVDRGQPQQPSARDAEAAMTESLANDMWIVCGGPPTASPPPYEIAILMPSTPRPTILQADSLHSSSDRPAPVSL